MQVYASKLLLIVSILLPVAVVAQDTLPPPYATRSAMNFSNVIGWKKDQAPIAPAGFNVTRYADAFQNPRWMYQLPNGDVLVAESNTPHGFLEKMGAAIVGANKSNDMRKSADRITLLRDINQDGFPDQRTVFLENLNLPFGMLLLKDNFYVANTDGLWIYPYTAGQLMISQPGKKILDLPAGKHNRHWTRNIITNREGTKIYIAIGSGSNVAEKGLMEEKDKARIWEINPDGSGLKVYATGLRNPVGMDWEPASQTLWVTVNERDGLGDNLVPDYFTAVQEGGFYGWPFSYFGQHPEPRIKKEEMDSALVKKAIQPDISLGPHTASLGLAFYTHTSFPEKYRGGAFIAQHGSWNRSNLSGYAVVFVPFRDGKPSGPPEDFLTGFIVDPEKDEVRGRPTGIIVLQDGSLLLTDDTSDTIWRISTAG
ncbi:MAG: sorbosone dehydrogenase family protein [Flavihumibacter sp.]|nr:sorbosone dehydrogenase family protein [Flavihumibacter sp.]